MLVEVDLFPIIEEDVLNNISEHEEQWWSTVVVLVDWKVVEVVVLSAIWSDSINEDDDNKAGFSLSEVCDSVKVDVVVGQVTIVLVWTSIIVVVKICVESFDVVVYNDSVVFDIVSIIVIDVNGVSVETVDIWLSFVKLDLSVETVDCRIVESDSVNNNVETLDDELSLLEYDELTGVIVGHIVITIGSILVTVVVISKVDSLEVIV